VLPAAPLLTDPPAPGPALSLPSETPAVLWLPDGRLTLNEPAAAAGILLQPLAEADAAWSTLGRAVPAQHGFFEALNAAAWSSGLWVKIPRRTTLASPLRILVPATGGAILPRLLVVVEEGAKATVVEEHCGGGQEASVVGVSELHLAAGARLQYTLLQNWDTSVRGHLTVRAVLARDADFFAAQASFGGAATKVDLGAVLTGPGARSEVAGVVLGQGRQHFDHHTAHVHQAPHTWSNLDFKVALAGRARSAYTGLIRIDTSAPHSEAYQENRNLMLSDRCRADTIPELEILTDEVGCSHGATVAPVDPGHLFYLQSRGISASQALRLVVSGFLETTLRRLPAGLRQELEPLVASRLARLTGGAQ
jgi:Fe-S cluster assembly protein SufD